PNRCSTGLVAKNCDTRYSRRLLNPSPFKIIATVAVPTLTCCWVGPANASRYAASRISRQTPATIPNWSSHSTRIPAITPSLPTGLMLPGIPQNRHQPLRNVGYATARIHTGVQRETLLRQVERMSDGLAVLRPSVPDGEVCDAECCQCLLLGSR